jgi:hypothetical protein
MTELGGYSKCKTEIDNNCIEMSLVKMVLFVMVQNLKSILALLYLVK